MSTKGQVTIPKELRDQLRLRPGTRIDASIDDQGRLVLAPALHEPERLADDIVLEPDLVVVLDPARVGSQVIDAPVALVVEILWPGTATRDLGPKRRAYEEGGVREYWIVDPETASIEVLALHAGAYARTGLYRQADTLVSHVLQGLEVPLAGLL